MPFSPLQLLRASRLPESIYVELIDDLFSAMPLIVVFAITQCIIGAAIFAETGDFVVLALVITGVLVSCERLMMVRSYHRATAAAPLSGRDAGIWEQHFAIRSIATGVIVSAMGVRCFTLSDPAVHMLIVGVLFSYAAGTITRVAYRPRLALFNLLVVSLPSAITCLFHDGMMYLCLGISMVIFMFGAFDVIRHSYETIVSQLMLKRRFAGLAQRDALTGLSNRHGLNENLETVMLDAQRNGLGLAVHSLDLDRFKTANDLYGHPVGDAVLKEVARRLMRLTRASDLLVRLGGDEFILVQTGVTAREQAAALASRILKDIGAPYAINGHRIEIGTSIGIDLVSGELLAPEALLARADQALYQAKRSKGGFVFCQDISSELSALRSDQLRIRTEAA